MLIERTLELLRRESALAAGADINAEQFLSFTEHGDMSSNAAFALSKSMKKSPFDSASAIAERIEAEFIESSEPAKPGFVNIAFTDKALAGELKEISSSAAWGARPQTKGKVNVEFVSANPTGPLVLVNAKAGITGNALCRMMRYSGYDAVSETYVNDAGSQVKNLGASILFSISPEGGEFPENGYRGSYIADIAKRIKKENPSLKWSEEGISLAAEEGKKIILEWQKESLKRFGIEFDSWVFESAVRSGMLARAEKLLREKGFVYESEGATYLRTTDFGDDKDRVIYKSNREMTYFLPDIAYHLYKAERGFEKIIDILGPDHHGYVSRIKSSMAMLADKMKFDIIIAQHVTFFKNNEKYEMSKRSGDFISMDELADEIDPDVIKFLVLSRKISQPFNFDIEKAKETTMENPVYYVQYAYARLSSLMRNAGIEGAESLSYDFDSFDDPSLRRIASKLLEFPYTVYSAAETYEIQKLPNYTVSLSSLIHSYYHDNRIITEDKVSTNKRLAVMFAARRILKASFEMMGITVKERMEKNEV